MPADVYADPALIASQSASDATIYPHLLGNTEIWFPVDDKRAFRSEDPGGQKRDFGFVIPLFGELQKINGRTWAADDAKLYAWSDAGPPEERQSSLEDKAKFGLAVLRDLCYVAHRNRLVMVLDY